MKQTKLAKHWQSSPGKPAHRTPRKTRKTTEHYRRQSSDSSGYDEASGSGLGIKSIAFSKDESALHDDHDEEEFPKTLLKTRASPLKRQMKVHSDSDDERDPTSDASPIKSANPDDDSEDCQRPRKRKTRQVVGSDEEPRPKKRLTKGVRPPTPEPEDLMDELDTDVIIEPRMRKRTKKSAYQKNLDKLKRKKLGLSSPQISDQDDESEDSEEGDSSVLFEGARPSSSAGDSNGDNTDVEVEDSFIVQDDVADVVLPSQFSRNRHRDLSENFKILCQLMVHVALQTPDGREVYMQQRLNDDYFSIARDDLRNKMSGILIQTITSQIWKKPFQDPLKKYPIFEVEQLVTAVPYCDACRLTKRVSTRHGTLSGEPYRPLGFEPVIEQDLDSSGANSDGEREEPSDDERLCKVFDMGRFCARRAQLYHSFCHWEYHLFRSLDEEVGALKHPSDFVKVKSLGSTRPPDDLTDGDAVMDWLDDRGVIEQQFHILKQLMKSGQNLDRAGDDDE